MANRGLFMRTVKEQGKRAIDFLRSPSSWDYQKIAYPFYFMFHPLAASYDIKYERRGSVGLANIIACLYFLVTMVEESSTGFIFNLSKPEELNGWLVLLRTVILLLMWAVVNWSLCTLMDGEGRFSEIWIFSCYSIMPAILFTIPKVLLSNVLTMEESAFLTIAGSVISGWCILLLFLGTMYVQQYSFKKTIFSMFLTVVGIVAVVFLLVLLFSLLQQFYLFIYTVFQEVSFR